MAKFRVSNPFKTGRYCVGFSNYGEKLYFACFKPLQNGAVLRSRPAHDHARRPSYAFQTPSKRGGTA